MRVLARYIIRHGAGQGIQFGGVMTAKEIPLENLDQRIVGGLADGIFIRFRTAKKSLDQLFHPLADTHIANPGLAQSHIEIGYHLIEQRLRETGERRLRALEARNNERYMKSDEIEAAIKGVGNPATRIELRATRLTNQTAIEIAGSNPGRIRSKEVA